MIYGPFILEFFIIYKYVSQDIIKFGFLALNSLAEHAKIYKKELLKIVFCLKDKVIIKICYKKGQVIIYQRYLRFREAISYFPTIR